MKHLRLTSIALAATLLAAGAFAADVQKPALSIDLESELTINTQAFPADLNAQSNARIIAQPFLPTCGKLPAPVFTAKGSYAENVCFTESTLGSRVTTLGAKIVYFNVLPAAKTYTFKGSATGHASKTAAAFTVPANTIAAACMNAKFNSAKGINYYFNFATGMSPPPASFCQ